MIITYQNKQYKVNEKYSLKDFTGLDMSVEPIEGIVYGSCFSQEEPYRHIFTEDMKGVTFLKCNLSNVFIPEGNTVIDCKQIRFEVQEDGKDWYINEDGSPTKPL